MSEPVAVIDVGSNSIKLLVAARRADGSLETLCSETAETRISEGISHELPFLKKEAMKKGIDTIIDLHRRAGRYHPSKVAIVGTSAVRDALNGMDFIDAVEESTGVAVRILSGVEEATYIGAGLACDPSLSGTSSFIQMDLGGGSLELIKLHEARVEQVVSLRLGAVRISERFIGDLSGPVSTHAETAIRAFVTAEVTQSDFSFLPANLPLIATGGAFVVSRAILAAKAGQTIKEHPATLLRSDLEALKSELVALTLTERQAVPHLPAARADIIPTALITILAVLQQSERDRITHSFYNLRYGIAAELLA